MVIAEGTAEDEEQALAVCMSYWEDAQENGQGSKGGAMELKYLTTGAEFKAEGDEGIYKGHFSIFGNVDDGGDVIHAGAFAQSLEERRARIRVFYAHDWSKLIGPPPNVIVEDEAGLFAEGRLTLNSFWGREAWELMKDGALTEGSIGYRPDRDAIEYDDDGVRHLYKVMLYEISPVPLGMNPLTDLRAVKALGVETAQIEALTKSIDALMALVAELKAGRALATANEHERQTAAADVEGVIDAAKHDPATLERRVRAAALSLRLGRL